MRLRWMFRAAAIGVAIPLVFFGLVLFMVNPPFGNYVFGTLIPLMGYILLTPHDPLIWEGIYFLVPIFMLTNAVIYGLIGLLLAQLRLWSMQRTKSTQPESPRPSLR